MKDGGGWKASFLCGLLWHAQGGVLSDLNGTLQLVGRLVW